MQIWKENFWTDFLFKQIYIDYAYIYETQRYIFFYVSVHAEMYTKMRYDCEMLKIKIMKLNYENYLILDSFKKVNLVFISDVKTYLTIRIRLFFPKINLLIKVLLIYIIALNYCINNVANINHPNP